MNRYAVKIRIYKGEAVYTTATFEIVAKSAKAADSRVFRLFSDETVADGDGIEVVSVECLEEDVA